MTAPAAVPPEVTLVSTWWTSLGDAIGARWAAAGRHPEDFPEIAAGVLTRYPAPATGLALPSLAWLAGAALPHQHDLGSGFGQPAVTVYRGDGFIVYLLFWFDETTLIHDHRFNGAFSILEGQSLQNVYRFEAAERVSPEVEVGRLRCTEVEVLGPGDVRRIPSGPALIHSNLHFGSPPTLSLVARTLVDARDPQRSYTHGGLAFAGAGRSPETTMRLQGFAASCRIAPEAGSEYLRRVLPDAGPVELLDYVAAAVRQFGSSLYLDPLLAANPLGDSEAARQAVSRYARQLFVGFVGLSELRALGEPADRLLLSMVAAGTEWKMATGALQAVVPDATPRRALCHLVAELLGRLATSGRPSACALSEDARCYVQSAAGGADASPGEAVYTELVAHRLFGSLFRFVLDPDDAD